MTVREAFARSGHPVPDEADYYFKVSGTKFMVLSSYAGLSWMFGPGVGVMDESWFVDSWYEVPMKHWIPIDDPARCVIGSLPECIRQVKVDIAKLEGPQE